MSKASRILILALAATSGAYLLWAYPRLPERVPMKWDMADRPAAFGTRDAFVGVLAAVTVFLAGSFFAATWLRPKAAWLGPVILSGFLLVVHASIQAILGSFWPVSVTAASLAAVGVIVGACLLGAFLERRSARA